MTKETKTLLTALLPGHVHKYLFPFSQANLVTGKKPQGANKKQKTKKTQQRNISLSLTQPEQVYSQVLQHLSQNIYIA